MANNPSVVLEQANLVVLAYCSEQSLLVWFLNKLCSNTECETKKIFLFFWFFRFCFLMDQQALLEVNGDGQTLL
jgi:hypothetical protein